MLRLVVASARKPASAVQHLVLLAAAHAALAHAIQAVGHQAVPAAEAAAVAAIAAPGKPLQRR
jgi:hypothetical protein